MEHSRFKERKMNIHNRYDKMDPQSIFDYSKGLIGKTFDDILLDYFEDKTVDYVEMKEQFNNPYRKGSLGNLVEEYYFGYKLNSSPEPDFPEAGVELKVSPYDITKTGKIRAGERLVLGMIPNNQPMTNDFFKSTAYKNLELMLLILYYRNRELERIQYPIHYSQLISIHSEALKKDLEIIKSDYKIIADKIRAGKAHELSEADTMYLGAATKGATAKKSLQAQFYNKEIPAKRRAFSLKQGYMSTFINDYIIEGVKTYDEIVHEPVSVETFEEIVVNKIESYKGYSKEELMEEFNLSDSKSIYSRIALSILDVHTENAEEFEKSNTQVKIIRIGKNGMPKEHMSFPAISFQEFANEEWEESYFYDLFSETRFLFVIYVEKDEKYYLDDAVFWHMPVSDLEYGAKEDWLSTQNVVRNGVKFRISANNTVFNSLPNASKTNITHLRPHATLTAYYLPSKGGFTKGNVERDTDILPNGDYMTKQGFWLNKKYLINQIKKEK